MARCRTAWFAVAVGNAALMLSCGSDAPGGAGGSASLEPCSVLSAEEASAILKGPVTREVPSPIHYKGISTGGTCMYRLQKEPMTSVTIRTDATPTGAQKRRFEAGRRHAKGDELSGIGDHAYFESQVLKGSEALTFLRGETLATVTVAGLGVEEAKRVSSLVAPRLPTTVIEPPPPPPTEKGSGKLDPALIGSWFLKQPNGRAIANLRVEGDGRFYMTLLAGNKQQRGNIDGENGVLHLYPDGGGRGQEVKYKILDKDEMQWTDQKGVVTIARRQFR